MFAKPLSPPSQSFSTTISAPSPTDTASPLPPPAGDAYHFPNSKAGPPLPEVPTPKVPSMLGDPYDIMTTALPQSMAIASPTTQRQMEQRSVRVDTGRQASDSIGSGSANTTPSDPGPGSFKGVPWWQAATMDKSDSDAEDDDDDAFTFRASWQSPQAKMTT